MEPKRWESVVSLWDQLDRVERNAVSLELEREIAERLTPAKTASVTAMKAADAREKISEKTSGEIPWLLIDIPGDRPGADIGLQYVLEGQRRRLRKNDRAVGEFHTHLSTTDADDTKNVAGCRLKVAVGPGNVAG